MNWRKILCHFGRHDLRWKRVVITSSINLMRPEGERLTKWRGDCSRCDHYETAIPAEDVKMNLSDYPELNRFVKNHSRVDPQAVAKSGDGK